MRIAHIVDSMDVGGAEVLVALLCRLQVMAGHSAQIHCLSSRGSMAAQLEQEGIPVHLHGPSGNIKKVCSLAASLRWRHTDIVHCHNIAATVHGCYAARLAGIRAVISTRHGDGQLPQGVRSDQRFWRAVRFCSRVIAVSDATRTNLINACREAEGKITTIRNGALPAAHDGGDDLYPIAGDDLIVVTVARLSAVKDLRAMIEAIKICAADVPRIKAWIVGDGPERQALQDAARELGVADRIVFFGERRDVGRFLDAAHLFALSSRREGLPVSLIEAMAAGLPCVVTDVGGMPEVVRLSGGGVIIRPGFADQLASAIVQLANDGELRKRMAHASRECYERFFRPERMAADYEKVYRESVTLGG